MPINEYQFFNGVVLNNLVRNELNKLNKPIKLDVFPSSGNNAFTINDKKVGIYIKYSKKIISPWRFTFLKEHQDEFKIMNELCENAFLILVCNKDGIASIKYKDIKKVLDEHHEEAEWISASRLKRQSYAIKGSDGKLKFKINLRDFPRDIVKCL
jgi:hypothetical protein|tara:strand:- start:99 stop:563 length:465 start_codon:yes stop_codon:yes gene_type:complete